MLEIDGSRYSGSGTIVRQATMLAALTRRPVRLVNVRVRRPQPGLRPQHVRVVEAISGLVGGRTEGVRVGSREFSFWPGTAQPGESYVWDIGSAGSTTLLALAALPVLALGPVPARVELRGGVFQDFAPSFYHVRHVLLPLVHRLGLEAKLELRRPGYVPRGGGWLQLQVSPSRNQLRGIALENAGPPERFWGIALASHLERRRVAHRMADAAQGVLSAAGYQADFDVRYETTAVQPGAALAVFADLADGVRLGADWAAAPRRPSEKIGRRVAQQLLEDLRSAATLDRHAADQVIPFAALAEGESRFRIPRLTEHIESNSWLVKEFLGAEVCVRGNLLTVAGVGFRPD